VTAARWAAGLPARAVGLAGRHRLLTALLVAGAAIRVLAWVALQPVLFYYGDSYVYLSDAVTLTPNATRPAGYPLLVHLLLPFHNLAVIPAVQHLFGLVTAILCYALLRRLGGGPVLAASVAAVPVLFDAYLIDLEQYLLAETMFILLMMTALALLVWRTRPSLWACALAGALLGSAALTRTVGLTLIVPVLLYCILRWFGVVRIALVAASFAAPLIGYAFWYDSHWNTFSLTGYDGYFLYGRVSTFADCADWHVTPAQRQLCFRGPPSTRHNPNYYVWQKWTNRHLRHTEHIRHLKPFAMNSALRTFSLDAIEHQPVAYASTILGDLVHYVSPGHWTNRFDTPSTHWVFPDTIRATGRLATRRLFIKRHGGRLAVDRSIASILRAYQKVVFVQGPLLALAFLAGLAAAAVGRPAGGRRLRAEALLFSLVGLSLPATAAATTMFDYRYALPAIPPLTLAAGTAVLVAESRVRAWRAARGGTAAVSPAADPQRTPLPARGS
jgi:4-amino-4-deoxy-L-arabinose transferase-like glycosyltransferase